MKTMRTTLSVQLVALLSCNTSFTVFAVLKSNRHSSSVSVSFLHSSVAFVAVAEPNKKKSKNHPWRPIPPTSNRHGSSQRHVLEQQVQRLTLQMLRSVDTSQDDRGLQLLSPIVKLHRCCLGRRQLPNRWQDSNAQTVLTASSSSSSAGEEADQEQDESIEDTINSMASFPWNRDTLSPATVSPWAIGSSFRSSSQNAYTVSIRKTQMQQIMSDLLEAETMASSSSSWLQQQDDDNDASTKDARSLSLFSSIPPHFQTILQANHDALMAPFVTEKENALFFDDNPDSIYATCTTPQERYHHYRSTLTERMASARDPMVRRVLQSLHDYVTHYVVTQQQQEEEM